jgi:four helix bundle protein
VEKEIHFGFPFLILGLRKDNLFFHLIQPKNRLNWRMQMTNKEFAKQMEKRTQKFAAQVVILSKKLPYSPEGRIIKEQLTDAGTSVGANYREANRARSQADFRNKMHICESECAETQYWLQVIVDAKMLNWEIIKPVYEECSQILGIFTSANEKLDK